MKDGTGVVDSPLPRALEGPTLYAQLRDLPLAGLLVGGLIWGLATRPRSMARGGY